jgi:hypothetical protein
MTAAERATIIKVAVDDLAAKLPLEWSDSQGRRILIERVEMGEHCGTYIRQCNNSVVWFKLSVGGTYLNGDGWYGYPNPPIMVEDGTYHDEVDELTGQTVQVPNFKVDPLAAFFGFIEQAVS